MKKPSKTPENLNLVRALVRAAHLIRAFAARKLEIDGHMVAIDPVDGHADVYRADGMWLGWTDAAGNGQSMAGFNPGLRVHVEALARRALEA